MTTVAGSTIAVRDAEVGDASAIAAIGRLAFPAAHHGLIDVSLIDAVVEQTYSLAALRDCITHCRRAGDAHFLVAERADRVVGYVHFEGAGPEPELHRIYVDPRQKRAGIGSTLMQALHDRLPEGSSYILLVVASNLPAIAFYQRYGMTEEARVNGIDYYPVHSGVVFPPGAPEVPLLVLRYSKPRSG